MAFLCFLSKSLCIIILGIILFCVYYESYYYVKTVFLLNTSELWYNNGPISCNSFLMQNWLKIDFRKIKGRNLSETQLEMCPNNIFNTLNLDISTVIGHPFISNVWINDTVGYNSTFRSLAKWIVATNFNNINVGKIECGDIVFVKIQLIDQFANQYHASIKNPYILITHEHDLPAGKPHHLAFLSDTKIIRWYAHNIIGKHSKLLPIPIGVMSPFEDVQSFEPLNNEMQHIPSYYKRSILLYVTFAKWTNKNRTGIMNYFKQKYKHNFKVVINENKLSYDKYLTDVKNSQFVLSPPGNGIDCFRTWEALYLGAVPIVMNTTISALYEDLPVMIVNNWTEVTEKNMLKFQREKLKHFSKDGIPWRPKAWFRYWMNQILEYQSEARKNVC